MSGNLFNDPRIYIYIYIYESESKSNTFFFSTGIITDTGTYVMHQNKYGPLQITSLFLNMKRIWY